MLRSLNNLRHCLLNHHKIILISPDCQMLFDTTIRRLSSLSWQSTISIYHTYLSIHPLAFYLAFSLSLLVEKAHKWSHHIIIKNVNEFPIAKIISRLANPISLYSSYRQQFPIWMKKALPIENFQSLIFHINSKSRKHRSVDIFVIYLGRSTECLVPLINILRLSL